MQILIFMVIYASLSYLASTGWKNRGLNQIYGFLIALFASPLGSYVICLALKDSQDKVKEEMLEELHKNLNMINRNNRNFIYDQDDTDDDHDNNDDDYGRRY